MIDKHALFQLANIVKNVRESYDSYQFFKIFQVNFLLTSLTLCDENTLFVLMHKLLEVDFMCHNWQWAECKVTACMRTCTDFGPSFNKITSAY